ncbi:MAG: T9SS type A sorting domain-containing protein [Flavipsychrobacter sp.]|nr:T9SS type A sorting domain-containing protein [Flavipsychrobacter sp.]
MKKFFATAAFACTTLFAVNSNAQSFTMHKDTATLNLAVADYVYNNVTNTTTSTVTLEWKVFATDFPADWLSAVGICDAANCFSGTSIWPPTASTLHESPYPASATNDFKLQIPIGAGSTSGTYYLRVRLNNKFATSDTAIATFIVTRTATSVSSVKVGNDVVVYPNPATSSLNVLFDAASDIKSIAVYNIIGKQVSLFRPTDNAGASLNVENIPSGIYFVRLMNSHGDVVATRKFTKQ